jgi:type IV secretion system protein TrbE
LRDYIHAALKTWRKHNASMLLATQAADDFRSADLLRTVVESCPTKLLLANPAYDHQLYSDLFQLNDVECQLLSELIPRREFLLKRPGLSKVLALNTAQ